MPLGQVLRGHPYKILSPLALRMNLGLAFRSECSPRALGRLWPCLVSPAGQDTSPPMSALLAGGQTRLVGRLLQSNINRIGMPAAPDFLDADLWPGITSGLPFAQNPKVMPDIESKLNLLMVSFARRRGDAAEFVDGVEQGNESFVFRLSVFLALWTISHCEALAIGFKIEVSRWMTAFTSLLLPYRPPRCTCRISR
jgi:hypothetical protein